VNSSGKNSPDDQKKDQKLFYSKKIRAVEEKYNVSIAIPLAH
jgi:hypothetical protein